MNLNLNSVMLGSEQPTVLAEFYAKLFDKPADMIDGNWHGWQVGSTFLSIGEHSEIKGQAKEPSRIMLVLETSQVELEFQRIKVIGAAIIKEPYEMGGMWIATFADLDGNYFQLMSPWQGNDPVNRKP